MTAIPNWRSASASPIPDRFRSFGVLIDEAESYSLLAAYQRCQDLLAHCRSKLAALEAQIQHTDSGSAAAATPKMPHAGSPAAAPADDDFPF